MNKLKSWSLVVALAFAAGACNYSNEFTGTYNSNPAKVSAYSKNINKYCVALTLESNGSKKNNFISAADVFNPNDFLATKSFNTKNTQCASKQSEYLAGTRYVTVLSTGQVLRVQQIGMYTCQAVYYKQYQYQEKIAFELRDQATDQVAGAFEGVGLVDQYVDTSRPVHYGPIYSCSPGPGPFPPYPNPYPPYPYPYPFPR